MKMTRRLGLALSVIVLAASFAESHGQRSRYDPAPNHHAGPQQSFVDWAFGRFNPSNIDYGMRLERMRQSVLDNTLLDPSFRIDTLLIGALCFLYWCYWWECRKITNLRASSARIVTACQSELLVAREQIARLTSEYAQARHILDERQEASIVGTTVNRKREDPVANGENKVSVPAAPQEDEPTRVDLLTENYSLKQQVRTLTMKWQEEQQKNRKPKVK
jgi:hypothetical protein